MLFQIDKKNEGKGKDGEDETLSLLEMERSVTVYLRNPEVQSRIPPLALH